MKLTRYLFASLLGLFVTLSSTQATDEVTEQIELSRWALQEEKRELMARNMELTGLEAEAFWPVYNAYQMALRKVNDRTIKLIKDYAQDWQNLSAQRARALLDEFLRIENAKLKLKRTYVRKFRKVLPPQKVARYFQLENKWDATIHAEVARHIPLMR